MKLNKNFVEARDAIKHTQKHTKQHDFLQSVWPLGKPFNIFCVFFNKILYLLSCLSEKVVPSLALNEKVDHAIQCKLTKMIF